MTVVEDPVLGEATARPRFGDGFHWYPADDQRAFDPVVDIAIGIDAGVVDSEWIAAAVAHCAQALAMLEALDPSNYRTVVSRTDRGNPINPTAIIGVSRWALIRRVVTDSKPVVIELGRTQRLFSGFAREAVMLLEPTCIWPGCDQPHTWCHADHLTSWTTRGPTNPHNGAPLCPRHNHLKETGFTIHRDQDGHWHITTPHGDPIG